MGNSCAIPVVVAESDPSLLPSSTEQIKRHNQKLRAGGEKGRDLQTAVTKSSLAQAMANGLRVPLSAKQKQQPTLPSVQQQSVKIIPPNATPKTRAGTLGKPTSPSVQQHSVKIVPANATPKTRAGTAGNKTRGSSSRNKKAVNKKRSNTTKKRNANKKQQSAKKKRSNNRVSVNSKKRKSSSKKNRGNTMNYKQSSNNKKTRVSGYGTSNQSGKNTSHQSGSKMNQMYSGGTSSFLHGINQALGRNKMSSGTGWGSSGKPVIKYSTPVSGWSGSAPQEPPIIWDGGDQTEYGVTGVLMPCPCYGDQSAWGSSTWGSSTTAGKSGKASSEKEHNCLCLVSELSDELPTTFMPTYFP